MFLPQLYGFVVAKDLSGGRLETIHARNVSDSQAAVSVSTPILKVPSDRVLSLSTVQATGTGGGAQTCDLLLVTLVDEFGNNLRTLYKERASAAILDLDRDCDIWIPPMAGLRATGSFSAGAAANSVSFSLSGVLFPRANVQIGALEIA